jgi:hypothetical protein
MNHMAPRFSPGWPAGHHHQVLERGHVGEFMRDLEGAQHAQPEQLVGRLAGDVLAIEDDLAAVGHNVAGDEVEQGGFTGAVRPDQARDRAALNLERAILHRFEAAKGLTDVLDVDNWVGQLAPA